MRASVGLLALALTTPAAALAGDTWPGWRGPTGVGLSDEKDLPLTWGGPANDNVVWKSPLPGTGTKAKGDHNQSSPVVWKDRVFVVTAYWPEGVAQTEFPEHHVACYAAADGKLRWDVKVPPGPWRLKDLRGGYAAPTPCTDGERVYALFGSSELAALDFDGRLVWRKEVAPFAWDVAVGTSPVLAGDAVLVLADGTNRALSRLIAFDRATGDIRWERKRPDANFNHTTPVRIEVGGKPQLVIASAGAVQGVDPADGAVVWWAKNPGDVPTPAYGGGLVYAEGGRGGPGVAVDPTGEGDVTGTKVRWKTGPIPEGYSSPTIAGGHVYRADGPGVLRCFALATGRPVFAERLPAGVNTSASPVATADGRLYFAGGGKSVVLAVGPTFEPLATNDLGDGGAASPAVAHGRLYLKGGRYLYCIGKPGGRASPAASRPADPPAWRATLGDLVGKEKAGFGGLCGVAVDPAAGTVWINVSDRGFYRSDDQAQRFRRCGDQQPKGRTESPGCLLLDPAGGGKRLVTALVYGSPVGVSADGGATWRFLAAASAHADWCAADFTDPDLKFVLALRHEAGGLLLASRDGGKTFAEVGKGYGPGWVFDGTTAVVAEAKTKDRPTPNLVRTTDGGKTWRPCGAYSPVGVGSAQALPRWHGGSLYWLVEGALIASDDRGATWKKAAGVTDGRFGPVFGKDARHLFVLTGAGVVESTDGGATWAKPIPPPPALKGVGGLTWLAYDPKGDVLYLMKMGSDLFKLARG